MTRILQVFNIEAVDCLINHGIKIGKGSYSTIKFAIEQGKPTFIAIVEE